MNLRDGFQGGLEIDEAVETARQYEAAGASALVLSCGFTAKTPLYMMRGNVPTREMARGQEQFLLRLGMSLFGWFLVQRYPFENLFLLKGACEIRKAVDIPVVYVGGVLSLTDIQRVLAAGLDFIEIGRATVRDPQFVNKLQRGDIVESDCDQCNRCIAAMSENGVYCVSEEEGFLR